MLALYAPGVAGTTPVVTTLPAGLSVAQLSEGLKSGLGSILEQALSGGESIEVQAPSALSRIQAALSKSGKTESAASFSDALAGAVAKVSPEAADLMQSALKDVKIEDAQAVLSGGPDAGTQYFKKNAGPALREKLLPLVKQATASSGLAASAKEMLGAAGPLAALGGNKAIADLDGYVTDQVLDQSFALMAKQEAAVRANPSLLTGSPLAQKVFALFKK